MTEEFKKITKILSLKPAFYKALTQPQKILKFQIPIKRDNGQEDFLIGFRVQHNNTLGPYKGGIRFTPQVTEASLCLMAELMTWKTSLMGLPFGGAKGGVAVDPFQLSVTELERLSRGYVRGVFPLIGPEKDIPAPDLNTNPQIMAWMVDEYSSLAGHFSPAAFTGKPLDLGGLPGRVEATGYGGVEILKALAQEVGLSPLKTTIAIQGFGNVGYFFSFFAWQAGFKIVAISEKQGGVYVRGGIDPVATWACKEKKGKIAGCYCQGSVCDLSYGQDISNKELLEMEVDILVPAATEDVITKKNASKIRARYIIEMANHPITSEAAKILEKRGVLIVPDILANSGGVVASYFEWLQNRSAQPWKKQKVFKELSNIMRRSFEKVLKFAKTKKLTLKHAALGLALQKVAATQH